MALRENRKFVARFANGDADVAATQALRGRLFRADGAPDVDGFDKACSHVLVEEVATGRLVCSYRLMHLRGGDEIDRSYAAQYYELSGLRGYQGAMVEMGRFCLDPEFRDPDIIRTAWGALTGYVDRHGVGMLFGCSSFHGTEAESYLDAFTLLRARHLAPKRWRPQIKAPSVYRFGAVLRMRKPDLRFAMKVMPPLLKTYLAMGGWVSDHAVVDRDLNTLHVFTGVEIARIPPVRARLLRAYSV